MGRDAEEDEEDTGKAKGKSKSKARRTAPDPNMVCFGCSFSALTAAHRSLSASNRTKGR